MNVFMAQITGILAVVTFLFSYQLKRKPQIILCNVASRGLYILQYLLLGAISGAVLDILAAIASVIAERMDTPRGRKHIRRAFCAVNGAIILVGGAICLINQSLIDLLPIVGVLFETGAFWVKDERVIRRVSLGGAPFWLAYNLLNRAYPSAIGNALTIVSITVAMLRYRKAEASKSYE